MSRQIASHLFVAALVLAFALGGVSSAGKGNGKGKGGGGGDPEPPPAGTIYFGFAGPDNQSMAADGSDKTAVTVGSLLRPVPAHDMHDGSTWYAGRRAFTDAGVTYRELVVAREDGLEVPFWKEVGAFVSFTRWAKDDSFLVFKVFRPVDGAAAETAEILRIEVDWTSGTPVPGAIEVLVAEMPDDQAPFRFDVSPDGTQLVFNQASSSEVWIKDLTTSELRFLAYPGLDPEWSHDGTRIAYVWDALHTIAPDGSGHTVVLQGNVGLMGWCRFSPDDQHIAFIQERLIGKGKKQTRVKDIVRIPAAGGTAVSLTDDVDADPVRVVAWR